MNKLLRVTILSNSIALGGMEMHYADLACGLSARGCDVSAIVPENVMLAPIVQRLRDADVQVCTLSILGNQPPRELVRNWFGMRSAIRNLNPDIVHQHRTGPYHGKWACLAARCAGVPGFIATEHQPAFRLTGTYKIINHIADTWVDKFIVVSEHDRTVQLQATDRAPDRVVTIHNGIAVENFQPVTREIMQQRRSESNLPPDAPIIGIVARLHVQKGIKYLMEAMVHVRAQFPDAQLLIVGDGPERANLEMQARELGIADSVHFWGFRTDVAYVLSLLDVFAHPSEWESLGLAPLEAMAMQKPVVLSRVGGQAELLVHDQSGLYVEPQDANALARALMRLLRDETLRARLGENARRRVAECFSRDVMVTRMLALYESVLKQKGSL